jgi:hypothetical protein
MGRECGMPRELCDSHEFTCVGLFGWSRTGGSIGGIYIAESFHRIHAYRCCLLRGKKKTIDVEVDEYSPSLSIGNTTNY